MVLAFAVALLKFTMPSQPLSSRLSLAQAIVSANSQTKARSLGLETGKSAEEEGWTQGQPKAKILGREIAVMKRVGWKADAEDAGDSKRGLDDNQKAADQEDGMAFWGLDLEALRRSNEPLAAGKSNSERTGLPIYRPEAARSYLLKSFSFKAGQSEAEAAASPPRNQPLLAPTAASSEEAAGALLKVLDLVYDSWAGTLPVDELDRRAWAWYLRVRPDVAPGRAGWGQRGSVRLADVLRLKRADY